jgi:sugar lactone lactonase YvrE
MTPIVATPYLTPISPADAYLPEGPREVTVGGRPAIAWVNIQTGPEATTGTVNLFFWQSGERRTLAQPGRPGFILPTNRPNVVAMGMDNRLGFLDLATNTFDTVAEVPDPHPRTIINDGEIVPGGEAVVFGTKDTAFRDAVAGLYLWTIRDQAVTLLKDGMTCSNGKVIVRDGTGLHLFDIDSPKKRIDRYTLDVNSRSVKRVGTTVSLGDRIDVPDGMCAAGADEVIVAFYNPARGGDGEAVRFDVRTGKPVTKWKVPGSPRVTCPLILVRPDGIKLLLTTAVEGMPEKYKADSPNAGAMFIADTGLRLPGTRPHGRDPDRYRPSMEVVKLN